MVHAINLNNHFTSGTILSFLSFLRNTSPDKTEAQGTLETVFVPPSSVFSPLVIASEFYRGWPDKIQQLKDCLLKHISHVPF